MSFSITQRFQTSYAPKHADGDYPDDVDGPVRTLARDAGVAPYAIRALYWQVRARVDRQAEPSGDGRHRLVHVRDGCPASRNRLGLGEADHSSCGLTRSCRLPISRLASPTGCNTHWVLQPSVTGQPGQPQS